MISPKTKAKLAILLTPLLALTLWLHSSQADEPPKTAAPPANQAAPQRQPTAQEMLIALQQEAEAGNPQAMVALGSFFERADLITRNYGTALNWYKKAAAKGSPEGYYFVGLCYEVGAGTKPDLAMAFDNFQKGSNLGSKEATFKLGQFYLQGLGVKADPNKGLEMVEKSAKDNYHLALNELGVINIYGQLERKKDEKKALDYFTKAANLGFSESMRNIAVIYRDGLGRPANDVQALKWFLLARVYGDQSPAIQQTILAIRDKLKPEDVTTAEREATVWRDNQVKTAQAAAEAARANRQ
ncbi:MAG: sel1 repeat family protein [Deltaproteobacteria bacterium]|jgi:TPR repeat protein|nr:sel1 repeat family protein [Deltaproteobacteria bacterium]